MHSLITLNSLMHRSLCWTICMQGCGNKDFCPFEEFKVNRMRPLHVSFLKDLHIYSSHSRYEGRFSLPVISKFLLMLSVLQERIVKPHLKHDYNMICKINPPVASKEPASFTTKVSSFLVGLFSQKGYRDVSAESVKTEL